jgi:hypothetical protein
MERVVKLRFVCVERTGEFAELPASEGKAPRGTAFEKAAHAADLELVVHRAWLHAQTRLDSRQAMITRFLIFCVLLVAASGLPVPAEDLPAQARLSFEQMLRAGAGEATDEQIGKAEADIKAAMKAGEQLGECEAMLATVYGFELSHHPWKALWIGPKIRPLYRSALRREPENARVHYLAGAGFANAPEKFRDLAEAERLFCRAEELYAKAGDTGGCEKVRRRLDELNALKNQSAGMRSREETP